MSLTRFEAFWFFVVLLGIVGAQQYQQYQEYYPQTPQNSYIQATNDYLRRQNQGSYPTNNYNQWFYPQSQQQGIPLYQSYPAVQSYGLTVQRPNVYQYPYGMYPSAYPTIYADNPFNKVNDPYAHIPTEIIDVDQNAINQDEQIRQEQQVQPELQPQPPQVQQPTYKVEIVTSPPAEYVINKNTYTTKYTTQNKTGYHLVEHKPYNSTIRRVFTNDGTRSQSRVYTINLINGVEVTDPPETDPEDNGISHNYTTNNTQQEPDENELEENNQKDDDETNPEAIDRWPSLF